MDWIRLDYADAVTAFAGIPAWSVEIIVPLAFALIGLRYLLRSIKSARLYCLHRKVAAKAAAKVTARTST
jgi:TRAP-type C4-dicarboxylate transport system permease small subunit